jgi:hypothetical protein
VNRSITAQEEARNIRGADMCVVPGKQVRADDVTLVSELVVVKTGGIVGVRACDETSSSACVCDIDALRHSS